MHESVLFGLYQFGLLVWSCSTVRVPSSTCYRRHILLSFLGIRSPTSVSASSSLALLFAMANAASGMAVDNDCKLKFLELKRKKTYRYIIFKIDDKSQQIVVEKMGGPDASYESFTDCLPEEDCRYAVYDLDFVTEDNCQKTKIFFIAWSPDVSRIRTKMLYASSKDRFKRELDVTYEVQATDSTEIDIEKLKERAF